VEEYVLDSNAEMKLIRVHPLHLNPEGQELLSKIIKSVGYTSSEGLLCYVFDAIELIAEHRAESNNPTAADNLMKIMIAADEKEIDVVWFTDKSWRFSGIPWFGSDNEE
jgi:hypothetical protein